MKELILKHGEIALVDDEDYERCQAYSWYVHYKSKTTFYVAGILIKERRGPTVSCYLHKFIMNAQKGQRADHKDRNTLNNQKSNLRFSTHTQNNQNVGRKSNNKTGYKGIGYLRGAKKWRACIGSSGKRYYSDLVDTKEEAALEYDKLAKTHHGEFACLNFPEETNEQ